MYKSGRTKNQFMRPFVIEGNKLYIPPQRYSLYMTTLNNHPCPESIAAELAAIRALGFLESEIVPGTAYTVVVDHELKP